MKCPRCGFVSCPDLRECQKCGARLDSLHEQEPVSTDKIESPSGSEPFATPSGELSERVASFRRRRATLTENDGREMTMAFDFSAATRSATPSAGMSATSPAEQLFDRAFAERTSRMPPVILESIPLKPRSEITNSSSFSEDFKGPAAHGSRVVQFAEAPFSFQDLSEEADYAEVVCAPLGSRFTAGLIDLLLLLTGGCIFAALFMAVGGRLEKTPLDLGVALFIAAFWLFVYFAVFGSITWRTPGHAALGLEIRNLNGEPPTITESLLRAFGVLISISALALGVVWAALDSDGMGWHDHISGTVPTEGGGRSHGLEGAP